MLDKARLIDHLNDRMDEKISHGSTSGLVQYALLAGLRDQILRGDFDAEDDE